MTPLFKKLTLLAKKTSDSEFIVTCFKNERIILNQISTYFEPYFSSFLTGFAKNHNTQYSQLKMLELCKKTLDKGKSVAVIFMDLFKAFDALHRNLLIAKLEAYAFSKNSLKYIQSYLPNLLQKM